MKIGAGVLLFILFFIAKVTNHIDWSWFWVFSPLWIPIVVIGSIVTFLFFCQMIATRGRRWG